MDSSFEDCEPDEDFENELLLAARNGETEKVEDLLARKQSEEIELNINCKGYSLMHRNIKYSV